MRVQVFILFLLTGLLALLPLPGQDGTEQTVSANINRLVSEINHLSDSLYGTDFSLINGEEFRLRHTQTNGHPYYRSNSWIAGSVISGEREHGDLWLRYDIFDDRVILNHSYGSKTTMIALNKEVIDEFTLEKDHFIQLYDADVVNSFAKPGYYQELYTGKLQLLIKWGKYISGSSGLQPGEFKIETERLVRKEGVFYKLNGKSSLLRILDDHKEAVSGYIRSNAIIVRSASDSDLVRIFRYYDSLLSKEQ